MENTAPIIHVGSLLVHQTQPSVTPKRRPVKEQTKAAMQAQAHKILTTITTVRFSLGCQNSIVTSGGTDMQ